MSDIYRIISTMFLEEPVMLCFKARCSINITVCQFRWKLAKAGNEELLYYNRFTTPWTLSRTTGVSWYQKGKIRKVKPSWIYWSKR